MHFYKRAQIFVADLWGAYGRPSDPNHPFFFHDIHALTMFADYRIPQLLHHFGVLQYSPELMNVIETLGEIPFGSKHETEIRACTIIAVEELKRKLNSNQGISLTSIEVDWILWNWGENIKEDIKPHHRTLTIYY